MDKTSGSVVGLATIVRPAFLNGMATISAFLGVMAVGLWAEW